MTHAIALVLAASIKKPERQLFDGKKLIQETQFLATKSLLFEKINSLSPFLFDKFSEIQF